MSFYHVKYHSQIGKGRRKAIVKADSKEQASSYFNNPNDPFGMQYEVDEVREVKKIPEGWNIQVQDKGDFPLSFRLRTETPLDDPERVVDAGKGNFKVKDLLSASPPVKEHVMKGRLW